MELKNKHQKHPPLKRPELGHYHKLEWAIYGTTCGEIETFFESVKMHFGKKYRLSYIDADHSDEEKETTIQVGKKQYSQGHVFPANSFDDKFNLALSQAVFINGNHYPGKRQIVIINPAKKDSLHRRVEQLDNIDVVVLPNDNIEIYDFVKDKMRENTLVINQGQKQDLFEHIENEIKNAIPPLKALILAGGKSTRMKEDKSKLRYHDEVTQEVYLARMCQDLGLETYISKSSTEQEDKIENFEVIKDRLLDMGPFGAIISAFISDPDAAWLILACDLPYISSPFIEKLVNERSVTHYSTAYKLKENPFPEPLIAIYEPVIYKRMLEFLSLGYACPRKVLINSEVKHVLLDNSEVAFNANTPMDKELVINKLNIKA